MIKKLKLDKFNNINVVNFPDKYNTGIRSVDTKIEVVIYFINTINDVARFVKYCDSIALPTDNRTIMVYEKDRKDGVNRDSIVLPFKEGKYPKFKLRAPMLCSISNELSACVMSKDI